MKNKRRIIFSLALILCIVKALPGQEPEKDPFVLFLPVGYDLMRFNEQTIHAPTGGIGFFLGEQDLPFDQVERRFLGVIGYQPFIFSNTAHPEVPHLLHGIGGVFDARLRKHQLMLILQADSDVPFFGGLSTFQIGAGWGYEVIRRPNVSLILGAVLAAGDVSNMLPDGVSPPPVMPFPLIRFGIDTKWFTSSLDFITGPVLDFTIAPEERINFTGKMRITTYRILADLNCEFTLWYRLFEPNHRFGDFAGVGVGFKNEVTGFYLSNNIQGETFEVQRSSVFAALDLSIVKLQTGWIVGSSYLFDGKKSGNPGSGFFLSVQGLIPIIHRQ